MKKPGKKFFKMFFLSASSVLLILFIFQAYRYISDSKKQNIPAQPPEVNDLEIKSQVTIDVLKTLKWQNLDQLTRSIGTDAVTIRDVINLTVDLEHPVAVYLRGLLLMIDKKPEQALDAFDSIRSEEIPPSFLYPPYRLHRYTKPQEPNKYLIPLRKAIADGELPVLINARVQAQEGNLYSAFTSYLQTDPAQWKRYDIECLKKISYQEGLKAEVRRMIAGALKSRRLPTSLKKELIQIAISGSDPADVREFKSQLKKELIQDSPTSKLAVSSITRMLDARKLFLQRDYKSLLEQYQKSDPMGMTTETTLLLFLSAVELNNRLEIDRWGQEIKRRYPNQEVINWVNKLTTEAK